MSNPMGREASQQPKCTSECSIAKRNARLAEALGINPDKKDEKRVESCLFKEEKQWTQRMASKSKGKDPDTHANSEIKES